MAYTIFDCTQFLTFSFVGKLIKNDMDAFEKLGMNVIKKDEIASKKIKYLAPYLQEEVFELFDQEFIGIFEDWKDENQPPIELIKLKKEIIGFCQLYGVTELKFIIISCASENIEEDRIVDKTVHIDDFYTGMFLLSNWNFKESTDNLILTIKL